MFAKINGTELFFDIVSPALDDSLPQLNERMTLICLHGGLGFDHGYLRPGLDSLANFFNLIYVDYRGQGRSAPVPLETISLEQIANDVKELCDFLGIDRAIFLGHSAGGFVAQILAIQYPELVQGLILSNTSAGKSFSPSEVKRAPTIQLVDRAPPEIINIATSMFRGGQGYNPGIGFMEKFQGGLEEGERPTWEEVMDHLHKEFLEKVGPYYLAPKNMDKFHKVMAYTGKKREVMDYFVHSILPFYDISEKIAGIVAPTLIISGKYDWVCSSLASDYIESQIPLSVHIMLEESGHMPFVEEPEMFQKLVRTFIEKLLHSDVF